MLVLAGVTILATDLAAQEPQTRDKGVASPAAPPPGGTIVAVPSPAPVDLSPHAVTVPGAGGSRDRDSVDAGPLKGVQARQVKSGEARLVLAGGERTVRPGDLIGADVVKSIEPGRILLARTLADGDTATVVITFDGAGRGRVRVYSEKDHSATPPLPVR
ncbi:MAG: hypothetical protein DMF78_26485 [Acidobacteria bacterium]|nr:MAG: hypothetical protein DMF78_26485 [Acidobacteriota bacterium]